MKEKLAQFVELLNEIYDLNAAQAVLGWDQHTYMPPGGAEGRGYQQAVLAKIAHQKSTSSELGELLNTLDAYADTLDPESDEACLIRLAQKDYQKNMKIDPKWVEEIEKATTHANYAWREARETDDFKKFQPALERLIELARQYADFFAPYEHVYDPLLDEFEPGMKTCEVQAIFDLIRPQQVELIRAIGSQQQLKDDFLHLDYPQPVQHEAGVEVVTRLGYNMRNGRIDLSAHPFTTSFGIHDVRFTTRYDPKNLGMALFANIHECGHALYDMGFSPAFARTMMANGASAGVHESQSRMYENLVGRSLPFWKFFYPYFQEKFPTQLGNVSLMDFYGAINRVEPSLIRVEADEATYNLHIMLRMELEIALMEGSLQVGDLPDAWNQRMKSYLGLVPPNDADGVLQDIHWSMGLMGYFPSYALGNLISVQLWDQMEKEMPDRDEKMEKGEFLPILDWLRSRVHTHGRKFEPQKLVQKITGSPIDPQPYIHYLTRKYTELYHL